MSLRSEIVRIVNELLAGSKKITELDEVGSATNDDLIEIVQAGQNVKIKKSNLVTGGGGGATDFTDLGDVPSSYAGEANKLVSVNAGQTGLEFIAVGAGVANFIATPSSANFAAAITDEKGTGNVILSEPDINTQTGSYTLVLADKAKEVRMNVASANDLTVPLNSSVAFPVGTTITVSQYGAGLTTIVATGGVTLRSSSGVLFSAGQYSPMVLRKIATDEWFVWNGTPRLNNGNGTTYNLSGNKVDFGNLTADTNVGGGFNIGFGVSPTSPVHVGGAIATGVNTTAITINTTLDGTRDHWIFSTAGGNITASLPDATTCVGRIYSITNTSASNTLAVDPNGTQSIDGSSSNYNITGTAYKSIRIQSAGALGWIILSVK